jgi:hypothetical protein
MAAQSVAPILREGEASFNMKRKGTSITGAVQDERLVVIEK